MSRIAKLKKIVKDGQFDFIDGVLVDTLTANCIVKCWEAGNDNTKEIIEIRNIEKIGELALRWCSK